MTTWTLANASRATQSARNVRASAKTPRDGSRGGVRAHTRTTKRKFSLAPELAKVGGGDDATRARRDGARFGIVAMVSNAEGDVKPLTPLSPMEAEALSVEVKKLDDDLKQVMQRLEKAQLESDEGEEQAKVLAEQALLATEAYEKDDELASSAMKATEEANKALVDAKVFMDIASERLRVVEEAVIRTKLVPSNDEDSAVGLSNIPFKKPSSEPTKAELLAENMGLNLSAWWDEEDLSLAAALERATEGMTTAERKLEEAQEEFAKREDFGIQVASKAKNSLLTSQSAHDRADEAMSKIAMKMQAVIDLKEQVNAIETQRAEKQRLIDGVKFDEASVVDVKKRTEKPKEVVKSAEEIKQEAEQELLEKRAMMEDGAGVQEDEEKSTKKSSKYFTAGYFSSNEKADDEAAEVVKTAKKFLTTMLLLGSATLMLPVPKCNLARQQIGSSLVKAGSTAKTVTHGLRQKASAVIEQVVPASERELAAHAAHEAEETGMTDVLWLLFTSVFAVTLVSKIPGGSPVLGFLVGGALVGPFGLGIITHVEQVKVLAEFGVVFLLFNIGLELSYDRLVSMAKYIFGLGSSQMALSTVVGAAVAVACGMAIPPAVIIGLGLAFSSTAVALQVLADRGESATRHGRATFSVLLFQDLTVVLVFMLVPLLAGPDSGSLAAIGGSLLKAVVKTAAAIVSIIGLGRVVLRPVFNRVAKLRQAELLSATTLFVALGTSLLTQSLGLSMALGAFLAGLLLAETEFHLQVENDIAPFRGLLLGLFFMTVGMTINPMTFQQSAANIVSMMAAILVGKIAVVCAVGPLFGLSLLNCLRAALYIGPGGEFAFVTFAEAVRVGLFNAELATQLNLAVVLTMAITPYLAEFGNKMKDVLSTGNVATLQPKENEVDDLKGHVILAGYGRQGKIIGEILAENMIPFVALDVNPEVVSESRAKDENVYFGDAGSPEVLKAVGADRASCAIVALSSPGANYRAVWTLNKNFNNVQTYVRARDVEGGLILEKAGAKAVVPEQLEPALQLAAACLREQKMAPNDITVAIDSYRRSHVKALQSSIKFSADYSTVNYGAMGRSIDQSMDVSSDEPGEVVVA